MANPFESRHRRERGTIVAGGASGMGVIQADSGTGVRLLRAASFLYGVDQAESAAAQASSQAFRKFLIRRPFR